MNIKRRIFVMALSGGLLGAGLFAGACSGNKEPVEGENPALEDVVYMNTNDEALGALVTATAKDSAAEAAVVDTPAAEAALPKDPPAAFTWHVAGGGAGLAPSPSPWSPVKALGEWLGEREAWAHGAPVNGRAYFLVFSVPGNDKLLRVFTTDLTYTPDAAAWSKLTGAGAPITLTITNALFEDSRISQDGGPFSGQPVTFTIAP